MGLFSKEEKKPDRFYEKSSQGFGLGFISVMVDRETGVNYIFAGTYEDISITPLIGSDGKVVVDEVPKNFGEPVVD